MNGTIAFGQRRPANHASGLLGRALVAVVALVAAVGTSQTPGRAQVQDRPAGSPPSAGRLELAERLSERPTDTSGEVSVSLRAYNGAPITALQFLVTASGPVSIYEVRAGSSVSDGARWKCFTNKVSPDTVRVVMFSPAGEGLTGTAGSDLLRITYQRLDPSQPSRIEIHNVVGGLPTGANAGLVAEGALSLPPKATE